MNELARLGHVKELVSTADERNVLANARSVNVISSERPPNVRGITTSIQPSWRTMSCRGRLYRAGRQREARVWFKQPQVADGQPEKIVMLKKGEKMICRGDVLPRLTRFHYVSFGDFGVVCHTLWNLVPFALLVLEGDSLPFLLNM